MSGTENLNIPLPLFMENEPLPKNYFNTFDPYETAPSCKVKIGVMAEYARLHNKKCSELTKEEFAMFKTE